MKVRFILCLLGVAAVALSGCSRRESGPGAAGGAPEDLVIARVGKTEIRGKDLDFKIKIQSQRLYKDLKNTRNWRMILDQMIEQQMIRWEAEKKGLENNEDYKKRIDLARTEILNLEYIQSVINVEAAPSDEELRAEYESLKDNFVVQEGAQVAHIVTATQAEAEDVRRQLMAGADWKKMVLTYTIDDKTRETQGALGWITADQQIPVLGRVVPELLAPAMAAPINGYTMPVQSAMGWHVMVVWEKRKGGVRTLEEIGPGLKERMTNIKAHDIYPKFIAELKKKYDVVVYEDRFQEFMEGPLGEQGLFDLAQKTTDSEQKIWYYEQIVFKFPGGDYADKAQFMVGFTRAEELRDYDGAEKAFKVLLDRYPNSELAESARWMIENMRNPDIPHLEGDPLSGRVPAGGS